MTTTYEKTVWDALAVHIVTFIKQHTDEFNTSFNRMSRHIFAKEDVDNAVQDLWLKTVDVEDGIWSAGYLYNRVKGKVFDLIKEHRTLYNREISSAMEYPIEDTCVDTASSVEVETFVDSLEPIEGLIVDMLMDGNSLREISSLISLPYSRVLKHYYNVQEKWKKD